MGLPTGGRLKFKNESMNHCIKCIAILAVWFYTFGAAYARNGQEEKIPTIQEFVDSTTRSSEGVLNVYEKGGHYYLEIPLKLMGRDFVSFVTIIKNAELEQRGSSSMYGYAGDALNPQMFRFLKGEDDVVYLQVADENVVELKENEIYDFIGELAIALYSKKIQISLGSLRAIMLDKGKDYVNNRGMASAVSAAYRRWKTKDPIIYYAIAYTFTDKEGNLAWDEAKQ